MWHRKGCGTTRRNVGPWGMLHGEEFGDAGDVACDGRGMRPPNLALQGGRELGWGL